MSDLTILDLCLESDRDISGVVGDVTDRLYMHPVERRLAVSQGDKAWVEFLDEVARLIAVHNKTAPKDAKTYKFSSYKPVRLPDYGRYAAIVRGYICQVEKPGYCRSRNFLILKRIAPKLTARIVFENTVKKTVAIRKECDLATDLPQRHQAAPSDRTAHKTSDIDFKRDVCHSENYDELGNGNVRGKLVLAPINRFMMAAPGADVFRAEIAKLIAAHNAAAPDGTGEYSLHATPPGKASRHRSAMSAAIVCSGADTENCRNRSVTIFRPIDSTLMARIVFGAALAKHPALEACNPQREGYSEWPGTDKPWDPDTVAPDTPGT
jgi:hypothetical protein